MSTLTKLTDMLAESDDPDMTRIQKPLDDIGAANKAAGIQLAAAKTDRDRHVALQRMLANDRRLMEAYRGLSCERDLPMHMRENFARIASNIATALTDEAWGE